MTVLTPSYESELDMFDLDLRVVPAESGQGAQHAPTVPDTVDNSSACSTGPLAGC